MARMMKQPVLNLDAFLGTREKKAILKMAKKHHGSDVELVYADCLLGQFVCVTPDMEFGV